jgi:NodT family efflux transporter outer membrane factor (OMF) lipoprotein
MKAAHAFALLFCLSACVAGPDYKVPPDAVANRPAAQGKFIAGNEAPFAQAELPAQWWRLYDDARLDAYVREALLANTDLRTADANLRRASFVVREAQAARTVQTAIGASTDAARTGGYTQQAPGTELNYSLGFSISYPLDLAGGIKRSIEAASADAQAVEAARDQARVVVVAAVAHSYAGICSANLSLAAARGVVETQRQTLVLAQRLQRGGRGTAFDVTRARTAADQSAAQIPGFIAARQGALFELAAVMGRTPSDYPRDAEGCAAPPVLTRPLPIGDGAALLKRRPDVRGAERSLAAATARIGVETAQLYPQVSLGGSVGFAGPFAGAVGNAFGGSAGPLFSWTWPNRDVAKARIAQAGAAADAADAAFDGAVLKALADVETALTQYARQRDRVETLERARDDARTASGQADRLFRFGRTGFLDVLTAQAGLAQAEAALAQARSDLIDGQVELFLALGGGWQGDKVP